MKKLMLTLIAAVTLSAGAMAQETNGEKRERPQMDPKEMIQQRTNETVKKYGLNEEQAQKLLNLNTRYFQKMGPMMGGPRGGRGGQRPQMGERPQRQEGDTVQQPQRRPRPDFGGNREEMRKNREAYDTELKTILTNEQYEAYKKDEQNRRPGRGNRGNRGQRPHND